MKKVELLFCTFFHLVSFWRSSENPGNDTMETLRRSLRECLIQFKLVEQRPLFFIEFITGRAPASWKKKGLITYCRGCVEVLSETSQVTEPLKNLIKPMVFKGFPTVWYPDLNQTSSKCDTN